MGFEADAAVVRLRDIAIEQARQLLGLFDLELVLVAENEAIPGSYWGECEAGLIGSCVHVRADTPVHSLLHEACHLMVLPTDKRAAVHTDATDSILEEDATCYLQLALADRLTGFGFERACADMDAWGYSFRLGSARVWFEQDADDARTFLHARGLLPLPGPTEASAD
ncbi:MAG: hypothetical protein KAZ58_02175 [Arenimonas sp.]|jgi:hypothetical protein|uniref:hypothetical protein n=1 Tax=Arenimonas sp. TaxID=1872635 RepID=UPI001B5279FD|nr:hypothetical protein [Arenimonas sp.]